MDLQAEKTHYNEQILALLSEYLKTEGSELRFCQLLYRLNECKDFFYEEPKDTLARFRSILYGDK